jgi:hypothetical protein
MPKLVVMGASLKCSFGTAPASLVNPRTTPRVGETQGVATIADHMPMANIPPFGMCTTPTNPMVAAATVAALGVLTPMPCIPATTSPWAPGSAKVKLAGVPALTDCSTCTCAWGGVIQVTAPSQSIVNAT